jgi:hypothetical protein
LGAESQKLKQIIILNYFLISDFASNLYGQPEPRWHEAQKAETIAKRIKLRTNDFFIF